MTGWVVFVKGAVMVSARIKPRRPAYGICYETIEYFESDDDWIENNKDAIIAWMESQTTEQPDIGESGD